MARHRTITAHLLLFALLALLSGGRALAEKRVALIIGNGAYQHAPQLPNPRNDADDVSTALKRIGFETFVGLDLDKAGMEDTSVRFARAARDADVAIFYYSGHALQHAGVNYLMPVDATLADEADLRRMTRVDDIVSDVQQARNLRILVLDSCRDNPLAEELRRSIGRTRSASIGRGLAKIDAPQGMIIAYATQAGRTAEDGQGRNSPYTSAFLKHIEAQEEIGTVFRRVSADVFEATKRAQLPELSLSLIGEYYLKGQPAQAGGSGMAAPATQPMAAPAKPNVVANLAPPIAPQPAKLDTTLRRVREREQLICGINGSLPGFSSVDANGRYVGLDADFCRALAAAIFDDPRKAKLVPVSAKERFVALQSGEIDVLARNTSKTAKREMELGLRFGLANFYDGQAFMVRKALGVKQAAELAAATVCLLAGTTTELNTANYFHARNATYRPVAFATRDEMISAYGAGRCDAVTSDRSDLFIIRSKFATPDDYVVLPQIISNETLAPVVRADDQQWLEIVTWVHHAMVAAEEYGITRDTAEASRNSKDAGVRRLMGQEGSLGEPLGLPNDFAYRVIRHVGNYGESFERNFGAKSALRMERGPNALVRDGGQQQAPPIR